MKIIEDIIINEPIEDVLAVFALKFGYPIIDRIYMQHSQGKVSNLDLLNAYQKLIDDGILVHGEQMKATKGPNWKAPAFIREEKYKTVPHRQQEDN